MNTTTETLARTGAGSAAPPTRREPSSRATNTASATPEATAGAAYLPTNQLTAAESLAFVHRPNASMAARIAAGNGWALDDKTGKLIGRLDVAAVLADLRAEQKEVRSVSLALPATLKIPDEVAAAHAEPRHAA